MLLHNYVTDMYMVFHLKLHLIINQLSVVISSESFKRNIASYCIHVAVYLAISLANWYIGGYFSLANRVILSVHCFMTFHNTCDYK